MKSPNLFKLLFLLLVMSLSFVVLNCSSTKESTADDAGLGDLGSFTIEKSGAILWGENCNRCHQAPDPAAFSDAQWEAIGTHMRIRAGLTAGDSDKIIEFLQQSN